MCLQCPPPFATPPHPNPPAEEMLHCISPLPSLSFPPHGPSHSSCPLSPLFNGPFSLFKEIDLSFPPPLSISDSSIFATSHFHLLFAIFNGARRVRASLLWTASRGEVTNVSCCLLYPSFCRMPEANGIFDIYSSGLTGRLFGISSYSPTVSSSFGMFEFVANKKGFTIRRRKSKSNKTSAVFPISRGGGRKKG